MTPQEDWWKKRSQADGLVAGALGFSDAAFGLLRDRDFSLLRKLYYQNALKLVPGIPRAGFPR